VGANARGRRRRAKPTPELIAREIERLRLLVEFDEADFAELIASDVATARQRRTWAIRCYRLWRVLASI
jgi:hypothetical protein